MKKTCGIGVPILCTALFCTSAYSFSSTTPEELNSGAMNTPAESTKAEKNYQPLPPFVEIKENYRWKGNHRYQISNVYGFNGSYATGEEINFFVEGLADVMEVNKANGFDVNVILYDVAQKTGKYIEVTYDKEKKAWKASFLAPVDKTKEYKVGIVLFCKKSERPCANTYGLGTQRNSILQLQVF